MTDESVEPLEPTPEEIDRIMSMRRDIIRALAPEPEETAGRIGLIGRLSGKAPTIRQLYLAHVKFEGLKAIAEGRKPMITSPQEFFETRAVSLRGKGRDELVRVASGSAPKKKKSWFGGPSHDDR